MYSATLEFECQEFVALEPVEIEYDYCREPADPSVGIMQDQYEVYVSKIDGVECNIVLNDETATELGEQAYEYEQDCYLGV